MKIDFTETEQPEKDFFKAALAEHDLRFLGGVREVEADAEILSIYITSRIDAAFLDEHPELKLITTRSAGHDHIDVSECSRRGVIVCELPGSNANTVAEHTFALMLALSRRMIEARKVKKEPRFSFERWRGFELENKTLGVIGTGQIGRRVTRLALAFGMKVLAYDPYRQTDVTEGCKLPRSATKSCSPCLLTSRTSASLRRLPSTRSLSMQCSIRSLLGAAR
jgi:D-lactate dehydrogenase